VMPDLRVIVSFGGRVRHAITESHPRQATQ
jgi:hypothetical protein